MNHSSKVKSNVNVLKCTVAERFLTSPQFGSVEHHEVRHHTTSKAIKSLNALFAVYDPFLN